MTGSLFGRDRAFLFGADQRVGDGFIFEDFVDSASGQYFSELVPRNCIR